MPHSMPHAMPHAMPLSPIMQTQTGADGTDTLHDMSLHAVDLSISSKLMHASLSVDNVGNSSAGWKGVPHRRRAQAGANRAGGALKVLAPPAVAASTRGGATVGTSSESAVETALKEAKVHAEAIGAVLMPHRRLVVGPGDGGRGADGGRGVVPSPRGTYSVAGEDVGEMSMGGGTPVMMGGGRESDGSSAHTQRPPRLDADTFLRLSDSEGRTNRDGSFSGSGRSGMDSGGGGIADTRPRVWRPSGGGNTPSTPDFISRRDIGDSRSGEKPSRRGRLGRGDSDPMHKARVGADNVARARMLYSHPRFSNSPTRSDGGSNGDGGDHDELIDRLGMPPLPPPLLPARDTHVDSQPLALPPKPIRDGMFAVGSGNGCDREIAWDTRAFGDTEYRDAIAHATHSLKTSLVGGTAVHQSLVEEGCSSGANHYDGLYSGDGTGTGSSIERAQVPRSSCDEASTGLIDLGASFLSAPSLTVSEAVERGEKLRRRSEEAVHKRAEHTGALRVPPQRKSKPNTARNIVPAAASQSAYSAPMHDHSSNFDATSGVGTSGKDALQEIQRRRRQYTLAADMQNIHRHTQGVSKSVQRSADTNLTTAVAGAGEGSTRAQARGQRGRNRDGIADGGAPRYIISSHIYPGHHGLCTHNFPGSPQANAAHVHCWR
jgi:hypothetical protein